MFGFPFWLPEWNSILDATQWGKIRDERIQNENCKKKEKYWQWQIRQTLDFFKRKHKCPIYCIRKLFLCKPLNVRHAFHPISLSIWDLAASPRCIFHTICKLNNYTEVILDLMSMYAKRFGFRNRSFTVYKVIESNEKIECKLLNAICDFINGQFEWCKSCSPFGWNASKQTITTMNEEKQNLKPSLK